MEILRTLNTVLYKKKIFEFKKVLILGYKDVLLVIHVYVRVYSFAHTSMRKICMHKIIPYINAFFK